MEFRVSVHLPAAPMAGDPIDIEGQSFEIVGEFSRLHVGLDRFAVEATDGNAYEVDVADAGNGRRGSQRWKAARRIPREEFQRLSRSPVV